MQHYKSYKSYDDDDEDDDIYGIESEDDRDQKTNNSINNKKTNKSMNNWLRRNWFITLKMGKEERHISFINIVEVHVELEGQKTFLCLVTSIGKYKCGVSKETCNKFCNCFLGGYLLDLHESIPCDSLEVIQ